MKIIKLLFLSLMLVTLVTIGCTEKGKDQKSANTTEDPGESLEKVNRYLVKSEKQDIENYIRRHGWQMEESGSGLSYEIYQNGEGEKAEEGKVAVLLYKTWLINGDLVYDSETDGLKEFLIGKGGVESGLEEGILYMRVGDKARFILPAHLAHGLPGDEKKIPPRTAIIYELELIKLK